MYGLERDNSDRQTWIDVLKGIGIILVVFGHINLDSSLVKWIYSFHMPMFFALSGYMWGKKFLLSPRFSVFLNKKIKSLLWPYILFRVLLWLYWRIIEYRFRELDLGPIWFLLALFIVELLAYGVVRIKNNVVLYAGTGIFAVTLMVIFSFQLNAEHSVILEWLVRILNAYSWYCIGGILGYVEASGKFKICRSLYARCVVCLGISLFASFANLPVSMWSNAWGCLPLYYLGGVSGGLLLGEVCKEIIKKNNFLEWFGRNTLWILATHEPIKRIVIKLVEIISQMCRFPLSKALIQSSILMSIMMLLIVCIIEILILKLLIYIKKRLSQKYSQWISFVSE